MRQRRVRNLDEKLAGFEDVIIDLPQDMPGRWREAFCNDAPVYLEIGCGKGQFIASCARKYPQANFIGIEGQRSVLLRALQKCRSDVEGSMAPEKRRDGRQGGQLTTEAVNVLFVSGFVHDVRDFFDPGELSGIFLNFSDPWPKARHEKRRLTYRKRLLSYMSVLAPGGFVEFRTDNDALFDFTLEEIEAAGLEAEVVTRDLHGMWAEASSGKTADAPLNLLAGTASATDEQQSAVPDTCGITTEYEDKFATKGKNINFVRIVNKSGESLSKDIEFFVVKG